MRYVISAVTVATVLAVTGMMIGAASAASVNGTFVDNSTAFCNYTTSPGDTVAVISQSQALSGTFSFDGTGGLTVAFVSNTFDVPAGTRRTSDGNCTGVYVVDADNVVTTDVACASVIIDGAGTGNITQVPSIKGRFLKVGDELFRMPADPPAEETVVTAFPLGGTSTIFRKCARIGAMRKGVR